MALPHSRDAGVLPQEPSFHPKTNWKGKEPDLTAFEDALPLIECAPDQPRLPLSPNSITYAIAKTIKTEPGGRGLSAQSVETKALNNSVTLNCLDLLESK